MLMIGMESSRADEQVWPTGAAMPDGVVGIAVARIHLRLGSEPIAPRVAVGRHDDHGALVLGQSGIFVVNPGAPDTGAETRGRRPQRRRRPPARAPGPGQAPRARGARVRPGPGGRQVPRHRDRRAHAGRRRRTGCGGRGRAAAPARRHRPGDGPADEAVAVGRARVGRLERAEPLASVRALGVAPLLLASAGTVAAGGADEADPGPSSMFTGDQASPAAWKKRRPVPPARARDDARRGGGLRRAGLRTVECRRRADRARRVEHWRGFLTSSYGS
ncbi:hypothetical protein G5V59_14560 [Nocardioides sp. W3-2-3]|uniref:hypothetical protein n=1 Tax=Nocardioides convexus TaxID=2712224 RepID=UPI00241858D4|nr:hypothetical protein [Nocardioides convexus]NHA00766.1 hypothetical protein [Nocardioides convexus]